MKILYLASVRIPSEKASSLAIVRQCEGFVKGGHQVDLLAPKRAKNEMTIEQAYGLERNFNLQKFPSISLFWLGKPGLALLYVYETIQVLWFFLKMKGDYDVIFSRDQYRILPFILLGLSNRCFTELHTVHRNFFTKIVTMKSKRVIVISNGLRDYYAKYAGREDILVEPSGVYLDQFENLPSKDLLKESFSIPKNKTVFGYVGKLTTVGEGKGVEEIIEAFARVQKDRIESFLFLAGVEPREREILINKFQHLGIPRENFGLTELNQSLFAQYLSVCDVLLMNYPNKEHYAKYMSPIKMFAYLAVGKPIVSSDLPTIREIEGVKGILYAKPDSVDDYKDKLLLMFDSIETFSQEAKSNSELARRYSWSDRAVRILH